MTDHETGGLLFLVIVFGGLTLVWLAYRYNQGDSR